MMWYKVLRNNIIIDVLIDPVYAKRQPRNLKTILCSEEDATMVLASDSSTFYLLQNIALISITKEEYEILKAKLFPVEAKEIELNEIREKIDAYDRIHNEQVYRYNIQAAK